MWLKQLKLVSKDEQTNKDRNMKKSELSKNNGNLFNVAGNLIVYEILLYKLPLLTKHFIRQEKWSEVACFIFSIRLIVSGSTRW